MLIIGHRGARGIKPENTLGSFRAGMDANADIIELDIQLTRDKVPIIIHDPNLQRTHNRNISIANHTAAELAAMKLYPLIPTLERMLDEFYGKILINIEVKSSGSARAVIDLLSKKYIKNPEDWDAIIISSFSWNELIAARRASKKVNLALLQSSNPFAFLVLNRQLDLTAVGFHRLHVNRFALSIAKHAKIFTYAYTVNRIDTAKKLAEHGLDGIVTDYPDRIGKLFQETD